MKLNIKVSMTTFIILLSLLSSHALYAHVMVAQHGTLNVIDDGVFMVLSLPVSAFEGVDDDKDGKLSAIEFTTHRPALIKMIHSKVILKDKSGKLPLQGIILAPVTSHHSPKVPSSQLIVMGRFTLVYPNSILKYRVELFGKTTPEALLEITATRKKDGSKQVIQLSQETPNVSLFNEDLSYASVK
jgi:hypothetical protein